MRPLTLHASALNDEEYELYTTGLKDLAWADGANNQDHDDAYYERMRVGLRETRGWLRGRYSHVPPASIDTILRFFSPNLSQEDVLSGGQVFAVLRLVVHAENGRDIDRGLAFVQAYPSPSRFPKHSPDVSLPPRSEILPPTPLTSTWTPEHKVSSLMNPFSSPNSANDPIKLPPRHNSNNPFVPSMSKDGSSDRQPVVPPLPPRRPLAPPPRHSSILLPQSGRKSVSPTRPISSPGSSAPALPPKPAHITSALMKQSLQASKAAQTMKKAEEQLEQERVLQVLKSSSVISGGYSLAGASVSGSSVVVGTNVSNRSASPSKFIYAPSKGKLQSLSHGSSDSDEKAPPLPRRQSTRQQQPSPPVSVSSLEQVALAAPPPPPVSHSRTDPPPLPPHATQPFPLRPTMNQLPYRQPPIPSTPNKTNTPITCVGSLSTSPSRTLADLPSGPPPTHPDRKPPHFLYNAPSTLPPHSSSPLRTTATDTSDNIPPGQAPTSPISPFRDSPESSPTARVFRSKSLNHPSPPLMPIPPPPRRKRPESAQLLRSGEVVFGGTNSGGGGGDSTNAGVGGLPPNLSRHASFSTPAYGHRRSSHSMSVSSTPSTASSANSANGRSHPQAHSGHPLHGDSPLSNFHRTLTATLQPKLEALHLQPRLERARYKAEAGLSKRGYVRDSLHPTSGGFGGETELKSLERQEKEELISGAQQRQKGWEREYDPPSVDGGSVEGGSDGDEDNARWRGRERDELKWPAGDGWKPL